MGLRSPPQSSAAAPPWQQEEALQFRDVVAYLDASAFRVGPGAVIAVGLVGIGGAGVLLGVLHPGNAFIPWIAILAVLALEAARVRRRRGRLALSAGQLALLDAASREATRQIPRQATRTQRRALLEQGIATRLGCAVPADSMPRGAS